MRSVVDLWGQELPQENHELPRYLHLDLKEDLAQERAIAEWLGEDPKKAVKAYLRQEHRYYDIIVANVGEDLRTEDLKVAIAPLVILRAVRTDEGKAARAERNRVWWRENGAAYRAKRRERDGKPLG